MMWTGGADNAVDVVLFIWFAMTALSVVYVAYDLVTRTPEMKVMKWGWVLVTLYTGPVALVVYWLSCREPAPGTHEKFVAPLWKQSVGSAIHCMAGDATGIIVAAVITSLLRLPMGVDAVVEYVAGFAFGLLIFQALFMKDMLGGGYWQAVKATWLPEWLSMNAVMAGMIPVMIILMTRDMRAMEPTSLRFWGVMSLASLVGAVLAYPVNWWLVKNGLKHGMGTKRVLGRGGASVAAERRRLAETAPSETAPPRDEQGEPRPVQPMKSMPGMTTGAGGKTVGAATPRAHTADMHKPSGDAPAAAHGMGGMMRAGGGAPMAGKLVVTLTTVLMLAGGLLLAARYGDLSMRAGEEIRHEGPMHMQGGGDEGTPG